MHIIIGDRAVWALSCSAFPLLIHTLCHERAFTRNIVLFWHGILKGRQNCQSAFFPSSRALPHERHPHTLLAHRHMRWGRAGCRPEKFHLKLCWKLLNFSSALFCHLALNSSANSSFLTEEEWKGEERKRRGLEGMAGVENPNRPWGFLASPALTLRKSTVWPMHELFNFYSQKNIPVAWRFQVIVLLKGKN